MWMKAMFSVQNQSTMPLLAPDPLDIVYRAQTILHSYNPM